MQVAVSQKATLSCEVADDKTQVKWCKDGKQLTPSRAVHADSKGKIRQLVFESVEKKDAGNYICEAGADKLAFKVQVTGTMCIRAKAGNFYLLVICFKIFKFKVLPLFSQYGQLGGCHPGFIFYCCFIRTIQLLHPMSVW